MKILIVFACLERDLSAAQGCIGGNFIHTSCSAVSGSGGARGITNIQLVVKATSLEVSWPQTQTIRFNKEISI